MSMIDKDRPKPTGFIAVCQCGAIRGALDYDRTDRKEAGQIMGRWLHNAYTVKPMFGSSWSAKMDICRCGLESQSEARSPNA